MFLKALGVKYLSRYKSYYASWTVNMMGNAPIQQFRVDEFMVSVDRQITGKGVDVLGPFKIMGTVSKNGFAEFEKRYTSGGLKPVTSFHGSFTNAMLHGQWAIKGQGSGNFQMKMEEARPFALKVGELYEVLYIAFVKNNSRLHAIGILPEANGSNKKFFILNGKVMGDEKRKKEVAFKFYYPEYPEQHYYLGSIHTQADGSLQITGTMESHKEKEWFSKAKPTPFELTELPSSDGPITNFGLGVQNTTQTLQPVISFSPIPHFPKQNHNQPLARPPVIQKNSNTTSTNPFFEQDIHFQPYDPHQGQPSGQLVPLPYLPVPSEATPYQPPGGEHK